MLLCINEILERWSKLFFKNVRRKIFIILIIILRYCLIMKTVRVKWPINRGVKNVS